MGLMDLKGNISETLSIQQDPQGEENFALPEGQRGSLRIGFICDPTDSAVDYIEGSGFI